MLQDVIGLLGAKGAGKDTAARFLMDHGYLRVGFADALYQEVALAYGVTVAFLSLRETKEKPLLRLQLRRCRDSRFREVGLREAAREQGLNFTKARRDHRWVNRELRRFRSPRWVLQRWGTEYRRRLDDDDYWLNIVAAFISAHPGRSVVVTDVRFPNEARFVTQRMRGRLARIRRPWLEQQLALVTQDRSTAGHSSEVDMAEWPTQHTLVNEEGQPDMLREAVETQLLAA